MRDDRGRARDWWLAIAAALLACISIPARAQFATGGSGIYRNSIVWFSWGSHGEEISNAGIVNRVRSFPIAGQWLRVTCSLTNIAGSAAGNDLVAYRPGSWIGDGLDNLYNIGGTNLANTLVVGLANRVDGATASGTLSCGATLGPTNTAADPVYPLEGLVMADAEQSTSDQGGEFVSATIAGIGQWRIIDRYSACTPATPPTTTYTTGATDFLRFNGVPLANLCAAGGPMAVAFMDGVETANFTVDGGGASAIALGVLVFVGDQGDAPASYGGAVHLPQYTWNGGVPSNGGNYLSMALATLTAPTVRLGTNVDIETVDQSGAAANGDDNAGAPDDEDALTTVPNVSLAPGGAHVLGNIVCRGNGASVYGYIDFNRDGDFLDPNERSAQGSCNNVSVSLSWTQPARPGLVAGASYLRLRIGGNALQTAAPSGVASDGEVEDFPILLTAATLTLRKQWNAAVVGDDATVTVAAGAATLDTLLSDAATAGELDTDATPVSVMQGDVLALAETLAAGNAGAYEAGLACTGAADANPNDGLVVAATDTAIVCTYTNERRRADLSVTKTNTPGVNGEVDQPADAVVAGATSYVVTARNAGPHAAHGAVVRDLPGANLGGCTATACTASGGAVCPAVAADLLSAGGAAVPTFPNGGAVAFTVQCTVN